MRSGPAARARRRDVEIQDTNERATSRALVNLRRVVRNLNRIAARMDRKLGRRLRQLEDLRS